MNIRLTETATLHSLVLPARADAADAAEFREFAAVRNAVYRELSGRGNQDLTPEALLPMLTSTPDQKTVAWIVRVDGEMVGRAMVDIPQEEGSRVGYCTIELFPRVWGQGIGAAALQCIEQTALGHGRNILQSWSEQPASDSPRLDAPTGFGSVPLDHVARFYQKHGFALEQVYRISRLVFDDDARRRIGKMLGDAEGAASGYRVVQWMLPTPPERVDGYAWMKSRMSTDAPSADLEVDEEIWDAARIERHDRKYLDGGRIVQVTAAEHIATGELCAFNELTIGADLAASTNQEDTLVLAPHRGHRLGMLVKCAALLSWREIVPDSPDVITYNAEENRPMLAINETIGFGAIAYEGAWKKELA